MAFQTRLSDFDPTVPSSELHGLPRLSLELLEVLEKAFPLKNPEPTATYAEIQRAAGQRDVIETILRLQRRGVPANVSPAPA